ncbi:hypothetical protein GCM10022252_75660 [Streptosporangium oxazolinicum]|uniref:T4 RNA ligase 1-like N-terminal domain-containing protein n=1 Tax=Streptosporangium oxazolinicum TaxID=909287 RepID=A0ABP8BKU5_9ACTN
MSTLTAPHLSDLLDVDDLINAVHDGYVREQVHPDLPLSIFNYTQLTQYGWHWTPVTRQCRGLIIDQDGNIVARPFPKFFNYSELIADGKKLPLEARAVVTDKLDGSLGILYPTGDGQYAVATRGSFTSAQAVHATKVWRERYADRVTVKPGFTYLFEIIYPQGRVVCDYGDLDDLVFLGAVEIATGCMETPFWFDWPGRTAGRFEYATLGEALAAPPRPGAEGFVVHLPDLDLRLKLKQADYKALHAVLTRTSARTLWEYLAVNACKGLISRPKDWEAVLHLDPARAARALALGPDWLPRILDNVPDEFHAWVRNIIDGLNANVAALTDEVTAYADLATYVYGDDRKAMAAEVLAHPHYGAVFAVAEDKPMTAYAWLRFYPAHDKPWMTISEDVA